jgi:hypothetical protein
VRPWRGPWHDVQVHAIPSRYAAAGPSGGHNVMTDRYSLGHFVHDYKGDRLCFAIIFMRLGDFLA